jgi:hypothetical protein
MWRVCTQRKENIDVGLEELLRKIVDSDRGDWNIISCLNTPSYLPWSPDGEFNEHLARAAYRPDVAIGLAWGIAVNDNYQEDWANDFTDPHAESILVDIFYNGMLVARETLVYVDGSRALLPIPYDHEKLLVRHRDRAFARLLDDLSLEHGVGGGVGDRSRSEFDDYFRRAGLVVDG